MSNGRALPPTLEANPRLGDWLRIDADGTVEVRSGKVELGQGVLTALAQIAAEELDVDVSRIRMTATATDLSPDEGMTAGSLSIQQSGAALRMVCAEARDLYLAIAAEKLAVPKEDLILDDGRIIGSDGAATSYWELADETVLDRGADGGAKPKPESDYHVVGTAVARIDLPDKLAGRPRYVHDLQFDDMAYGRVVRPPSRGATLTAVDTGPTLALSGVITVVRDGDFLAVIAEREEVALRAADRLRAHATWDQQPSLPDEDDLAGYPEGSAGPIPPSSPTGRRHPWRRTGPRRRPTIVRSSPTGRSRRPARSRWHKTDEKAICRSGHTVRACTTCAVRSRANWVCALSNWLSATSRAPVAMATTAPTTPQWTRRCSRRRCRADRCRWCGRGPTNSGGHRWEVRVWSGYQPTPRATAPCCPGGTRYGVAASSADPA